MFLYTSEKSLAQLKNISHSLFVMLFYFCTFYNIFPYAQLAFVFYLFGKVLNKRDRIFPFYFSLPQKDLLIFQKCFDNT